MEGKPVRPCKCKEAIQYKNLHHYKIETTLVKPVQHAYTHLETCPLEVVQLI